MTWWVVDKAIRESLLPPPARLVLRTLADQLNPPKDWDYRQGDAWDPGTSQELLVVWCDRETLTHATGYSLASLRRIMRTLVHDYAVLRCLEPAHQHYTAHWWFDLETLRGLRDPWFEQRATARQEARQSRRRHAARDAPATMSHNGYGVALRQQATGREPPPAEPSWEREWQRRYDEEIMGHRPRGQPGNGTHADGSQGTHVELSEKLQGASLEPSDEAGGSTRALSEARGLMLGPCFTPGVSPLDISPQAANDDIPSQGEPPAPSGAAGQIAAAPSPPAATRADGTAPGATDHGPLPELAAAMRQMGVRLAQADNARQVTPHLTRQQLVGLGQMLHGRPPGTNGNGHHPARDYDAERQRQFRAAREAGLDVGDRGG